MFVAYKVGHDGRLFSIPKKLISNLGDNLHTLSYPDPKSEDRPGIRPFFGPSTRTKKDDPLPIPCCGVVHLFEGPPYERKLSLAKVIGDRLPRESIDVQIRTDDNPDIDQGKPDELLAFLKGFDPVSGKTLYELGQEGSIQVLPPSVSDDSNHRLGAVG